MVLSKQELIAGLQHEVHILLHLCSKVEPNMLDYRPTEKQRSTIELLRYLTVMGPALVSAIHTGEFDGAGFGAAMEASKQMDLAKVVASIETQREGLAREIDSMSDDDFRTEIEMFGRKATKGFFMVQVLWNSFATYRMQLFLYLKACGRAELNTMNLSAGVDAPMPG
jgi:hypothetical protein